MYRWAFLNFEYKSVLGSSTPVDEIAVELSNDADFVQLTLENGLEALLPVDADSSTITVKAHPYSETVDAPVTKGQVLGTADIYYAEEKIGTVNLVAANDVKLSGMLKFLRDAKELTVRFFSSPVMIAIYIIIGLVIVIFIGLTLYLNLNKKKRRKVKYKPIKKDEFENDSE